MIILVKKHKYLEALSLREKDAIIYDEPVRMTRSRKNGERGYEIELKWGWAGSTTGQSAKYFISDREAGV